MFIQLARTWLSSGFEKVGHCTSSQSCLVLAALLEAALFFIVVVISGMQMQIPFESFAFPNLHIVLEGTNKDKREGALYPILMCSPQ